MRFKIVAVASATTLAAFLCAATSPASAQGFFDQLFGGQQQAAPAPSYGYDAPPSYYQDAPAAPRRAKRKVAVADPEKPKLQKPTDIMHDKTLENGDAVMTKDGLRLYVGNDGEREHSKSDFAGVDDVDNLPKSERKALVAMDVTRNDPLRGAIAPDDVSSGRSAAVATPVVVGRDIVDARGRKVRYVGP